MNPVERVIRRVDATQQRFTPTAFVFGVIKKYGDDNGGVLVANLAYSGFIALFPLLLVLVTVLGLAASVDAAFRQDVIDAVAHQVPQIGSQLTGQRARAPALQRDRAHHRPGRPGLGRDRAGPGGPVHDGAGVEPARARPARVLQRLGRAMEFLGVLGVGVILTTLLASLNTYGQKAAIFVVLAEAAAALVNVGMYLIAFRVLTPKGVPTQRLIPGAVAGGIAWTVLQILGTYLVHHFLHSNSVYGYFATVLGLVAYIYLAVADHRVRGRDQRGAGPAAVAALHRPAAAHRGRPGQHGAAGAAEPAARGTAHRGVLRRPAARRPGAGQHPADARGRRAAGLEPARARPRRLTQCPADAARSIHQRTN